jgi:hypothetical protein
VKLTQKGKMVVATGGRSALDKMEIELDLEESFELDEAFESLFETDRHGNTKSFLDAIMNVVSEKKELDPVNKKELKKDFDDRKDKDIDNDGDVDDSDEYLHKRRQAITKAVEKDSDKAEKENDKEISDKEDEPKGKVGKSGKQTKVDVNPSIEEEKGEPMTSAEMEKRKAQQRLRAIDKAIATSRKPISGKEAKLIHALLKGRMKTESVEAEMSDAEMEKRKAQQRLRAIDKAIATSRKPISGKEAKLIHALLKGRMKTESVEAEMSDAEMKKRDEIMKSLEKRKSEFEKKYGDRAKEVMARTAIKMAKKNA